MSNEYQWKQLGPVVNDVLMQARTRAIRKGSISHIAPAPEPEAGAPSQVVRGQLELPFGISPVVEKPTSRAARV